MKNKTTIEQFILKTDFRLLRKQKAVLCELAEDVEKMGLVHASRSLEGIISFIDSFQDMSVDTYGKSEDEVFGSL